MANIFGYSYYDFLLALDTKLLHTPFGHIDIKIKAVCEPNLHIHLSVSFSRNIA